MNYIKDNFANINIFPDKNLVISLTWLLSFKANDLIEADSWQLKSGTIFFLSEFTASFILASISKNFHFSFFFQPGL